MLAIGTALVALGVAMTLWLHPSPASDDRPDRVRPASSARADTGRGASAAAVRHVFVVNIENKSFGSAWGRHSAAPYLARTLRSKGVLLTRYFGTAHHSLPDYLAQISGQGPNYATQRDCPRYTAFTTSRPTVEPDQVVGSGCVYPATVRTLPQQLDDAGFTWRGYMEDMARPCQHPALGAPDPWQKATKRSQYATRHNPFVYFRSITSRPAYCNAHVVPLRQLSMDLATTDTTRNFSYLTPDLCSDAHDRPCADGRPGGMASVGPWMRRWVPQILRSPAFRNDGMLIITADESDGVREDSSACCGEGVGPNAGQPGIEGPGGGRIGALVISPFAQPGATSSRAYNHYSLLGSIEDIFGVPRLGYARTVTSVFGPDVLRP